jgi:hypothetical protein
MPRGTHPNSLANLKKGNRFTKETASKEGKKGAAESNKVQKQLKSMSDLAKIIARSKVKGEKARKQLETLGIEDEDMTNTALIVSAIFRAAFEGDMKAVEEWKRLTGQLEEEQNRHNGQLADLIDGLKEPEEPYSDE